MIIVDENVEDYWIRLFESKGYSFFSIRDNFSGISDRQVIEIVRQKKGVLITEDKDFGELVFSHGIEDVCVILMRYDQPFYEQIEKYLIKCVESVLANPEACFITVTKTKIRNRRI